MSLLSMTGFGASRAQVGRWSLHFELRSVNHKALELRFHCRSPEWSALEPLVHKAVRAKLSRGHITVALTASLAMSSDGVHIERPLEIDEAMFVAAHRQLKMLTLRYGLRTDLSISDMMLFSRAFMEVSSPTPDQDTLEQASGALEHAIDALLDARRSEGATLQALFHDKLHELADHLNAVELMRPKLLEGYQERLRERLSALIQQAEISVDEQRLVQELALFTDRTDIAEELQRARAHVERVLGLIESAGPVGKQLDFYLQELIRETNTMGSKSSFASLTDEVIAMKSIIEQLREQAANVE
jgi:uncharacterized protein (TIGR00255 family)